MTTYIDGMFYIDRLNGDFYLREAGHWNLKGNIWIDGRADHGPNPSGYLGLYIDVDSGSVYENGALVGTIAGSGGGPSPQAVLAIALATKV
jgi:hypothetical protein